jgi:phage gp36-like protein
MALRPKLKEVAETEVYAFDFARELNSETIVEIVEILTDLQPGSASGDPLTVVESAVAGTAVRVRLSGGADGGRYRVAVKVRDSGGGVWQTPQEFVGVALAWSQPDGTGRYLSLKRFVERAGVDRTTDLTDEHGRGTPDPEVLGRAIADAEAEIDSNLAARYDTPLSAVPEVIETVAFDLAIARLYLRTEPPAGIAGRAKEAKDTLRRLASGAMTLPNAAAQTAAPSTSPILISSPGRIYPPGSLDEFSRG